ncbi:MAG: DUF2934 domain-containing protein [Chthoniobacteraceae bacterium]|jgi:hypothetical protein
MGKKIEPAMPAPAIAESPAPKISTAPAEPPATNGEGVHAKREAAGAAGAKPAAKKKAPAHKPVTFSTEDIALRAYFISEHRHRHGLHGDSHSDWIEAERQLHAEHKKKTSKKAPATKKKR